MTNERNHKRNNQTRPGLKRGFTQAFKQAPWRNQIQYIGFFLLALMIVLVVASVYLSISGRAATAGLEAYRANYKRIELEREIADRKAKIALSTASTEMEERAKALGFVRIDPTEAIYVLIPGYTGKRTLVLAPPPGIAEQERVIVKSDYKQSLWDWLFSGLNNLSNSLNVEGQ